MPLFQNVYARGNIRFWTWKWGKHCVGGQGQYGHYICCYQNTSHDNGVSAMTACFNKCRVHHLSF